MSITVQNICKSFGDFQVLRDMSFSVSTGELIGLLGPSGSGKTTLLRIIAGLEPPDSGTVLFDGRDAKNRRAKDRQVGFVFQHYALFKHMTVFDNVAFGLRVRPAGRRPSRGEIKEKVMRLIDLVQLGRMAFHFPSQLSGGQRQRVALARALAVEPKVLLLDEPFGSLDAGVRKELRQWLRRLHEEIHITSLFVTHDQEEALEVADRVVVINEGRIEQIGSPEDIYHAPATPFVYRFLGNVNLFRCRIEDGMAKIGAMSLPVSRPSQHDAVHSCFFVRPHLLEIQRHPRNKNCLGARVLHVRPAGPVVKIELESETGEPVTVELSRKRQTELHLMKNDAVYLTPAETPENC